MTEPNMPAGKALTGQAVADALEGSAWRSVLGILRMHLRVRRLSDAVAVADMIMASCSDVDERLWFDIRRDKVAISIQTPGGHGPTAADVELARAISVAVGEHDEHTGPDVGDGSRSVQALEVAIDALDIASVRPFWKAVLGYVDEPGSGPEGALVDPLAQGPPVWFQQMDAPRQQRNRIHLDISVPHDAAEERIRRAIAVGGTVRSDADAPAFWVLADPEGNEACISTWQGRDPPG